MGSNQGRDLSQVLKDVSISDVQAAAKALWKEAHAHPHDASCECPALEALAVLYERGYRLVHNQVGGDSAAEEIADPADR